MVLPIETPSGDGGGSNSLAKNPILQLLDQLQQIGETACLIKKSIDPCKLSSERQLEVATQEILDKVLMRRT